MQVWSPPLYQKVCMTAAVALEPLRNAVLLLAGVVILLALFLMLQRSIAAVMAAQARRREPFLSRMVYEAAQSSSIDTRAFRSLGRLDRSQVRAILLELALDLRGDTGDTIAAIYHDLGFARADLLKLRSPRATTRAAAAGDLGLIRCSAAVPDLLEAFNDHDVRVRQAAVWAVGQAGDAAALQAVIRLLADPSRAVVNRAQEVLAERGPAVVDSILAFTERTSSRVGRLAAIELLGLLRVANSTPLLLHFMSDLDPEVRVKSVKAAAAIGDPRFLETLHRRLEDTSWAVRCQAAKGLSLFGSPASVPPLSAALRDQHWWVRFYAATGLADSGPVGEAALYRALADPSPSVRDMASYLLGPRDTALALP